MKPTAPLLALPCSGMKPPSPLRALKGHFAPFRPCKGVAGFNGTRSVACKGVAGLKVAPSSRAVREKVRPARPCVAASAKKFALRAQNGRKTLFSGALGELFRGRATGCPVPGELFRGSAAAGPHGERAYACRQSLRLPLISRGEISHAIPFKTFQMLNSDVEILLFLATCGCELCGNCMRDCGSDSGERGEASGWLVRRRARIAGGGGFATVGTVA